MKDEEIAIKILKAAQIIKELEKILNTTFLSFVSTYPIKYIPTAYKVGKILRKIGAVDDLTILIESGGGDLDATAKIAKMLRGYAKKLRSVVAFAAKSAATYLVLCTDEIVMCRGAELGPIDPIVKHPTANIWIPAHSIYEAIEVIRGIDDPLIKLSLSDKLDPLLLGAYQESMKESRQYLKEALSDKYEEEDLERIVDTFTAKYFSHGYPIDRDLCKEIGLNVKFPEPEVEKLIFSLYDEYIDVIIGAEAKKGILLLQTKDDFIFHVDNKDETEKIKDLVENVKKKIQQIAPETQA